MTVEQITTGVIPVDATNGNGHLNPSDSSIRTSPDMKAFGRLYERDERKNMLYRAVMHFETHDGQPPSPEDRNRIVGYYEPIYRVEDLMASCQSSRQPVPVAAETVARWEHGTNIIMPGQFLDDIMGDENLRRVFLRRMVTEAAYLAQDTPFPIEINTDIRDLTPADKPLLRAAKDHNIYMPEVAIEVLEYCQCSEGSCRGHFPSFCISRMVAALKELRDNNIGAIYLDDLDMIVPPLNTTFQEGPRGSTMALITHHDVLSLIDGLKIDRRIVIGANEEVKTMDLLLQVAGMLSSDRGKKARKQFQKPFRVVCEGIQDDQMDELFKLQQEVEKLNQYFGIEIELCSQSYAHHRPMDHDTFLRTVRMW